MSEALNFKQYVDELEKKGYRCTYYGDIKNNNGLAYYEIDNHVLKIEYIWNKVGKNH